MGAEEIVLLLATAHLQLPLGAECRPEPAYAQVDRARLGLPEQRRQAVVYIGHHACVLRPATALIRGMQPRAAHR